MTRTYPFRPSLLNSDHSIWFIAIALSLLTHAALFLQKNLQLNAVPSMIIQKTITHVRFANLSPPPVTVVEPVVEIPKPEPVVIPEKVPEKVVKKKPEPIPKPKPKPKPKKKPAKKPPVKVKQTPVKPQPVSFTAKPQINKEIKTSPIVSKPDQRLIEQTRKSYFALLMRHIEVHKHYPRIARKRKIEGKILVTFTLLANGSINNLQVNGKRSILEKATENAVDGALPMPIPPGELDLPMDIKFTMNYFLK